MLPKFAIQKNINSVQNETEVEPDALEKPKYIVMSIHYVGSDHVNLYYNTI